MNWRIKRKKDKEIQCAYFEDHPYCEVCGKPAIQVHEIIFRSQGGKCTDDNMVSLCLDCHQRAHFLKKPYLRQEHLLGAKLGKLGGVVIGKYKSGELVFF